MLRIRIRDPGSSAVLTLDPDPEWVKSGSGIVHYLPTVQYRNFATHFNLSNSEQLCYLHLRSKPETMYISTALTCRCLRIYTWNIVNLPCQITKLGTGIWDSGYGAFLTPDPGSDIRDPEWVNIRIQDKHPGSAILKRTVTDVPPYPSLPHPPPPLTKKYSTRRRFNTPYSVHVGDILPHTQYM